MNNPFRRLGLLAASATLAAVTTGCGGGGGADSAATEPFYPPEAEEWLMVWSDEFDGDSLNLANWDIQEGDGSEFGLDRWGNNEQQWYTADNIDVADGMLTITARAEQAAPGFFYTSARIRTENKFEFTYGRIEASIQAAEGQGLWSAFWMLPTDSPYSGWASSGEIDIMEIVNANTDLENTFGTLHHGFAWPLNQLTSAPIENIAAADEFNLYAIEWSANEIRWYVNDVHYMTISRDHWYGYYYADQQTGYTATEGSGPFDVDFHALLNLAVGGNLPGSVNPGAIPAEMKVDYVRVYTCTYDLPDGTGCNTNADRTLEVPRDQAPFEISYDIFGDMAGPLEWSIAGQPVTRQLAVNSFWDNDGALTFSEVGAGDADRGMVIDVMTNNSGNISINAVDGEPTSFFGMGNNPNFWELHAGELKFDLYVDSAATDPESSLLIKMDSGFPALGSVELKVADLPADEWTTISVKINDLLANSGQQPLNTSSIMSFFVLEPTSSAHVQIDNIEIACGHPASKGCGILPPGGGVDGDLANVFIDAVDPLWSNGMGAWDDIYLADYLDGNTVNHVTWSVVPAEDPGRGDIIMTNFGTNGANGVFYIQSASGIDMGSFAARGSLKFDLMLEAGSTHGVTYKVDCFHPCSTGDQDLNISGDTRGEWHSYEISAASIISNGVDIGNINSPIVIFPTWGDQQGVTLYLDNIRWENPGAGPGEPSEETLEGTWMVAPEAGALAVGPEAGSSEWWSIDAPGVVERSCFFDDEYVFEADGSFSNVLGADTWIEGWQGGSESCSVPVFPHDGMNLATWSHDEGAGTVTISGTGSYLGLSKANNDGELASPVNAPASITYSVTFQDSNTIIVSIEAGSGVFWTYKMIKVGSVAPPPLFAGTWKVAPEAGSLAVGPDRGSSDWWSIDAGGVDVRACFFDDEYVFGADGSFSNVLGADTWVEGWQGGAEACGAPVFPHDGMTASTYSYDEGASTLTITGVGSYLGLPKANNDGELASPVNAPASITYNVSFIDSNTINVQIEAGSGVHWMYKMVRE